MGAMALFRGSRHVCVEVNEEFARTISDEAVGMPAREVFIDPESKRTQVLMDATFSDGQPRTMLVIHPAGIVGVVTIVPVIRQSRVWGLVTDFQACAPLPTTASRAPSPMAGAGRAG